jgi:hypothetical protein
MIRLFLLFMVLSAPAGAQVAVSTPAATVDQLYSGKGRDPLVPATMFGDQTGSSKLRAQTAVAASSFTVYNLTLTGVIEDARGKQALLSNAANDAVYTLKAGRLFDSKKKPVPGVSGVIRGKQVILLTDDKKVHQINLREKE